MRARLLAPLLLLAIIALPRTSFAQTAPLSQRLAGRIVLQVQAHGEAWYIDPIEKQRYFLGTANDAHALMRAKGLGIRHAELTRYLSSRFPTRLSGRILLDVERRGEAYYVDPVTLRGSSLGRANDAYTIMRRYGLGITNSDLSQIPVAARSAQTPTSPGVSPAPTPPVAPSSPINTIEREAFDLINTHRRSIGAPVLTWNDTIAVHARQHSQNIANGSASFGHEGFSDRFSALQKSMTVRGIAENVAMNDYPNPAQTAVTGWINSPGHKTNLENSSYTQSGLGVAKSSDGTYYFTQIFIK